MSDDVSLRHAVESNALQSLSSTLRYWKTNLETEVWSGSGHPSEAMCWIKEVEMATSVDDLITS